MERFKWIGEWFFFQPVHLHEPSRQINSLKITIPNTTQIKYFLNSLGKKCLLFKMFYATEKCSKLVIVKIKLILVIIVKRHYFDLVIPQHCQGEIILGQAFSKQCVIFTLLLYLSSFTQIQGAALKLSIRLHSQKSKVRIKAPSLFFRESL